MRIEIDIAPRVNLALQQQAVPLVRSLVLTNGRDAPVGPLTVVVRADPPFLDPLSIVLGVLEAGARRSVDLTLLTLSSGFLASQAELERGALHVEVRGPDGVIAQQATPIDVLAPTHWTGVSAYPELLAAFVRPNARALVPVLQDASRRLEAAFGDGALCGYQRRDPRHAQVLVQAVWEAVQGISVTYIDPPASFEQGGQKIRTHEQVLVDRLGTCLDLSVLLAAALEQVGLHPLVVIVRGHAFVGAWLTAFHLPEAILDDPLPLRKRVELGEALVIDSSPVTSATPFAAAVQQAEDLLDGDRFVLAVDVAAARRAAAPVRPLPLDRLGADLAEAVGVAEPALSERALPSDRFRPLHPGPSDPDARPAPSRLDRWQQRLLDLSLRNRFLNHKENARSLPIPHVSLATLEDALASGRTFELAARTPGTSLPAELPDGERMRRERERAQGAQAAGVLQVDLTPAELGKQGVELHRMSRSALEESGTGILYLALGFLRWFESPASEQPRLAPLVLLPVELVRPQGDSQAWRLQSTDEETRVNVTLLEKLKRDFGIDARLDEAPTDDAGLDIPAILHAFRRAVLHQPRWEVVEAASVATFSFAKFLMWLDLAAKREQILASPVVRQILDGTGIDAGGRLPSEDEVASTPPEALHTVVDADPSQTRALLAAHAGTSFVLQGPPGTGKSQTITNLVAHLLGSGRTVLFVSEKRAALEVVHRRLEQAGLGPFCLELHSDKATRAGVVRQLGAPFELAARHDAAGWSRRVRELTQTRTELDVHAARLAAPSPFGVPLRSVVTELLGLQNVVWVPLPELAPTDLDTVRALEARTDALASAAREARPGPAHPLHAVPLARWAPSVEDGARQALVALQDAVSAAKQAARDASERLGLPHPTGHAALLDVCAAAGLVLEAPADVPRALIEVSGFDGRSEALARWVQLGRALHARRGELLARWQPSLFGLDLDALKARYVAWDGVFWLFAFFALWTARRTLQRAASRALPAPGVVRADLGAAVEVRDGERSLTAQMASGPGWLGARDQGASTDWEAVDALAAWARRFHAVRCAIAGRAGSFTETDRLLALATDDRPLVVTGAPQVELERAVSAGAALERALEGVLVSLELATDALPDELDALHDLAGSWLSGLPQLRAWCHLQGVARDAREHGLGPLVERVMTGALSPDALAPTLARSLREGWWRGRLEADPGLARFSGARHQEVVERFGRLDRDLQVLARQRLVAELVGRLPELHAPGEEMALFRRQLQLQKRHLPPRRLFAQMPTALRRIKPVVMMSPQSIARFLDPSLEGFDVVVFDEASQIPPWDAIGAIARGRQAIIVGDSKQLPPTSFFDRADTEEGWTDDNSIEELESILDEANASNLPELRLRWHYRSRHESLITFSNHHYYDGSLHTFPSADALSPGVGLELRQLPEGSYDRGGSRTNRPEAEAVVEEMEHLLDLPEDLRPTVGVVTFSMAQQRLVEDLVDALRARRPELERFFADPEEPVFVKNLENVQGDERDVMLFSIGYGPDRNGKLTMSFGPVNRKGGERRLNVAITRARTRLIVFSTLDPARIDLNRTSALGARHLKSFLRFAREGVRAIDAESLAEDVARFESPFEEQVHAALTAAGYTVHTQIGCSGYRVDLGVVDSERAGTYLLGIECDGATYHGSRSARERDRLRQAVLEQLGWRIARVWSTDWWHDRRGQTERLLALVEHARTTRPVPPRPAPSPAPAATSGPSLADRLASAPAVERPNGVRPWPGLPPVTGGARDDFTSPTSRTQLARTLVQLVARVGPVQRDQAFRHIARAWGLQSLGKRIVAALDEALLACGTADRPVERDGFLWPAHLDPVSWRTFRTSDELARSAQEIPPEELANAAAWVLERALSIGEDALIAETARVFGWTRVARNVQAACAAGLALLERDERAHRRGDRWVLPERRG